MKTSALPGGYSPSFFLAFLSCIFFFCSMHLLVTPLPLYIEEIGGSATDVGLAGTFFAISALVLRPYMGRFIDTRGSKPALLIGAAIFTVGPLSYTLTSSVLTLQVARMFHGIGIAAFTSAYYTLVADATPPSRWGAALGLAGIAPSLSLFVASPIGAELVEHVSFDVVFFTSGLTALAGLLVALLIRAPRRQTAASRAGETSSVHPLDLARQRGVLAPSLATLAVGLCFGTVYSFLPLFARDRGLGNVGFFFTVFSVFLVASRSMAGRLSDRIGRLPVILPMLGLLAMSLAGLNWTYAFSILITMAAIQGIGFGGSRVGLETMVVDTAPAEVRATALSLIYFCFDLGIAVAGVAMGAVADLAGYGQGYLLVGAVCLLAALLFGAAMRKPARA